MRREKKSTNSLKLSVGDSLTHKQFMQILTALNVLFHSHLFPNILYLDLIIMYYSYYYIVCLADTCLEILMTTRSLFMIYPGPKS